MDDIAEVYYKTSLKLNLNPVLLPEIDGFKIQIGRKLYFFRGSQTPFNNSSNLGVASNEYCANQILKNAGLPVPEATGITEEEYVDGKLRHLVLNYPVVIKPTCDSSCGTDVICNIPNYETLKPLVDKLILEHDTLSFESYKPNLNSYRVLVFFGKVIGVTQRFPAKVRGDGEHTIEELIKIENVKRKQYEKKYKIPLGKLAISTETHFIFTELGIDKSFIPNINQFVPIRYICNSTHGGTFRSLPTNSICRENIKLVQRAAKALTLEFVGFDVLCKDIGIPITKSEGYFIEANPMPDITIHENDPNGYRNPVSYVIVKKLTSPAYWLANLVKYFDIPQYLRLTFSTFLVFLFFMWSYLFYA